jgi:hypothetical protein
MVARLALGGILQGECQLLVSKCCKDSIYAVHSEEGTGYYVCRKCSRASDPVLINEYTPIIHKDDDNGNVQSSS